MGNANVPGTRTQQRKPDQKKIRTKDTQNNSEMKRNTRYTLCSHFRKAISYLVHACARGTYNWLLSGQRKEEEDTGRVTAKEGEWNRERNEAKSEKGLRRDKRENPTHWQGGVMTAMYGFPSRLQNRSGDLLLHPVPPLSFLSKVRRCAISVPRCGERVIYFYHSRRRVHN